MSSRVIPTIDSEHAARCELARRPPASPRVLVVDDDADLRALIALSLEHEGCRVTEATSASEAIDRARAALRGVPGAGIDVMITDVRMPGIDGMSLVKLLRDADFSIPIIILSGLADPLLREEAAAYGARVMDKPVGLRDLREAVALALARPSSAGSTC